MNRQQIYTLSGALLASTALSGAAAAGTVGVAQHNIAAAGGFTTTAFRISNTLFSTTAATANAVTITTGGGNPPMFAVSFANSFPAATKFNATINVVGAKFVTTGGVSYAVTILTRNSAGTFISTASGTFGNCTITPLVDFLSISNCLLTTAFTVASGGVTVSAGGIQVSGVQLNQASGLAVANTSISLNGTVVDGNNPQQQFESITSGNIITSASPVTVTVTNSTTAIANATTTPSAFLNIASGGGGGANGLTVVLATIAITSTVARGTDLSTIITFDGTGGSAASTTFNLSVTSGVLSDSALRSLSLKGAAGADVGGGPLTPLQFAGGTATFATAVANTAASNTVVAVYNGSVPIQAAAAGTATVSYSNAAGSALQAAAGASGATTQVTRGGFNAEINTFQSSAGDGSSLFQSFVRIHNNGSAAGAATITVRNDSATSGAVLGAPFNTSTIQPNGTLQLSAKDIETGAGITTPSGQYTLQVTGPIVGYVQHVMFNSSNNAFTNLTSFRNGGATTGVP